MTEKGYHVLNHIIENYKELLRHVVVGKDSNVADDFSEKIINRCSAAGINYYFRNNAPSPDFHDFQFCVSWRWLIKDARNVVIFHDSILPRYRGFSPLVNMLINGERQIGVTALFADQNYDSGPIIAQSKTQVIYPLKIKDAIAINNKNYSLLVDELVLRLKNTGSLFGIPQDEEKATYSIWRDNEDYFIDWNWSAEEIKRFVDAVGVPYNGALSYTLDNILYKISDVEEFEDLNFEIRHPGKVIFFRGKNPVVICGRGSIEIKEYETVKSPPSKVCCDKIKTRTRLIGNVRF